MRCIRRANIDYFIYIPTFFAFTYRLLTNISYICALLTYKQGGRAMEDTNDKQSTIGQLSAQDLSALSPDERMIQEGFNDLLQDYLKSNHRRKVERITKAFNFAKQAHDGVKRRSGEPYIMHPIAVAKIVCSEMGLGSTSICSALLHDVVEDTEYTVEDIRNMFGDKIAQIVDGLTKIAGGIFGEQASAQAENFRKLLLTMSSTCTLPWHTA